MGLRHACRTGTIIVREKSGPRVPLDIAHLRYIEYENSTAGLKALATQLAYFFDHFDREPGRPDNHFQEIAKLTAYPFPNYQKEEAPPPEIQAIMGLMEAPELLDLIIRQQKGEEIDQIELIRLVLTNPKVAQPFLQAMANTGELDFSKLNASPKQIGEK
ncbi:hypothetical protein [Massilia sp. WF1]|uniref:hypothetical protein n=1 Tax=Massilia sp. WF1 TaxID=1406431 RepID=UPI0012E1AFD0|nr:hypothetical protein [Massilia sp. WF1]